MNLHVYTERVAAKFEFEKANMRIVGT